MLTCINANNSGLIATSFNAVYSDEHKQRRTTTVQTGKRIKIWQSNFPNPQRTRRNKNQHIRNDERHVDQLRQTKTRERESTEKMEKEKGYWRLVGESETETHFSTNTRTNNKKKQHKVKKNNAQGLNIKRKKQPTLKNKNLYYAMTYRRRV